MAAVEDLKAMQIDSTNGSKAMMRSNSTLNLNTEAEVTLMVNLDKGKSKREKTRIPVFGMERVEKAVVDTTKDLSKESKPDVITLDAVEQSVIYNEDELSISPNVEKLNLKVNMRRNTNFNSENTLLDLDEDDTFIRDTVPGKDTNLL